MQPTAPCPTRRLLCSAVALSLLITAAPECRAGQRTRSRRHVYGHHHDHHDHHDLIDLVVHGRELHAVDGRSIRTIRLGAREKLLWTAATGGVAVALTDDRVIAITSLWREWQTREFGVHESEPLHAVAGDDFVVIVTDDRVLSLAAGGGSFVERGLGAYERVVDTLLGDRVALVLTDRRLIGYSASDASLVDERVGIHEEIRSANAGYDFATVATGKRLLVFDAPSSSWQSRQLTLH